MSKEAVAAFFVALKDDPVLIERLRAAATAGEFDELASELGRERGFEFTPAELRAAIDEAMSRSPAELTEEELTRVAGGRLPGAPMTVNCIGNGGGAAYTTGGTTDMVGLLGIQASVAVCRR